MSLFFPYVEKKGKIRDLIFAVYTSLFNCLTIDCFIWCKTACVPNYDIFFCGVSRLEREWSPIFVFINWKRLEIICKQLIKWTIQRKIKITFKNEELYRKLFNVWEAISESSCILVSLWNNSIWYTKFFLIHFKWYLLNINSLYSSSVFFTHVWDEIYWNNSLSEMFVIVII